MRCERRGRAVKAPSVSPQPCNQNENQCSAGLKQLQRPEAMVNNKDEKANAIGIKNKKNKNTKCS